MTPYRSRDAVLEADLSTAHARIEELEKHLGIDAWTRARTQAAHGDGRRRLTFFALWLAGVAVALHEENRTLHAEVDRTASRLANAEADLAAMRDHPSIYYMGQWTSDAAPHEAGCPLAHLASAPKWTEYRQLGTILGSSLDDTGRSAIPADVLAAACHAGADAIFVTSYAHSRTQTILLYAEITAPRFVPP